MDDWKETQEHIRISELKELTHLPSIMQKIKACLVWSHEKIFGACEADN